MNQHKHRYSDDAWGGGYHPGYCTTTGAHISFHCVKCGRIKVSCPQRRGHYYYNGGPTEDDDQSEQGAWGR